LSPRPPASRSAGDPSDFTEALKESHGLLALAEQSAGIGIWDTIPAALAFEPTNVQRLENLYFQF
jgi:hypothetical protein